MNEHAWELEPWRAPTLADGDELMYCEHGRIVYRTPEKKPGSGTDCRSHWFRVVRNSGGMHCLLVHHGAGEERIELGYGYRNFPAIFDPLSSDARYWMLWVLLEVHHKASRAAQERTAAQYKQAFIDGRLKKRKIRNTNGTRVWIE